MIGVPDYEGEDVRDFNWIEFTETAEETEKNESIFALLRKGSYRGKFLWCSRVHGFSGLGWPHS